MKKKPPRPSWCRSAPTRGGFGDGGYAIRAWTLGSRRRCDVTLCYHLDLWRDAVETAVRTAGPDSNLNRLLVATL